MLTMLAAVGEMRRDLLKESTQASLARARKKGKTLGRPTHTHTTPEQRADIIARHQARQRHINKCAVSPVGGITRNSNAHCPHLKASI